MIDLTFKTMTGKTLDEVRTLLDSPLPPEAYKQIPGKLDLTDINPAWTRRALTSIFGLFGFGWGMNHDAADIELKFDVKDNGKVAAEATVKCATFWYVMVDSKGNVQRFSFTCTGNNRSEVGNGSFALKGAMTNALGQAASFMGFQESVYMGIRSHDDTTASARKSGMSIDPAKTITTQPPAVPGADPTSAGAPPANTATPDSAASKTATPPAPPASVPPVPPAEKPAEKTMLYFACDGCGHPMSEYARPEKCPKCGNGCIRSFPTLAAAKRHTPNVPQEPPAAAPASAPANAADQACMACGSVVPVTPTCPDCGEETISTDIKKLHEEMKRLANNDRAVLLRRASEVCKRAIKGYAEISPDDLRALVYDLRLSPPSGNAPASAPANPPAHPATPPAPPAAGGNGATAPAGNGNADTAPRMSKVQLVQAIFQAAGNLGFDTPASILKELSQRWGRVLKSSSDLTQEELEVSLREFQGVKA